MKPFLFIFLILASTAYAEVDMSIGIDSDGGEINTYVYPNSGIGETNYYLDGKNFDQEVDRLDTAISGAGTSMNYIYLKLYGIFMEKVNNRWQITPLSSLNYYESTLRNVLDTYFVPRIELMGMIEQQQQQINTLQLEIKAMQKLIAPEKLCTARMQIVKEYNLDSVDCGNTTYYNHLSGDRLVGLTPIETPQVITHINKTEKVIKTAKTLDEIHKDLCNKGLKKFCITNTTGGN